MTSGSVMRTESSSNRPSTASSFCAIRSYSLKEFVTLVIEKSGYLAELQAKAAVNPDFQDDINNLQELVNVAEEFVPEEQDNILGEFLQQVALVSDLDSMED